MCQKGWGSFDTIIPMSKTGERIFLTSVQSKHIILNKLESV